ncbi:MAG TPA: hypothetical protein VGA69_10740 [Nitriliruptorales bacterium]
MTIDTEFLAALRWRNIGPPRGGRTVAVAGDPVDRATFYFGACTGGVWKTDDGGTYWRNVSDGFLRTASVGAIAVAPSDPQVVWVGTGEACVRNNVSAGDGVYRSVDAGATWQHVGLDATRHIARVRVHPREPDTAYVAALGDIFGPSPERGIYRTRDGGASWELVLHRDEHAGAADLWLDPTNPRILYAALWHARRYPWSMESGGPGSCLYRSTDGGDTWTDITDRPGLPRTLKGRMGICASPAKPSRVWALIEAGDGKGGLYRSEDRGESWDRVSDKADLLGRPWYYSHIVPDPVDPETVYAMNLSFWRSSDGGRTFDDIATPHGDNHDLWIDPNDPRRMIEGNDGGACVSFNGGESFSTIYNQLTAQIYRLDVDDGFPWRAVGTQQDNSAISVPGWTNGTGITWSDCHQVGFSESGDIAVDPLDGNVVFSGAVGSALGGGGPLRRYDHRTGQSQLVTVWPMLGAGEDPREQRHRFGWTYPVVFSQHDPQVLYVGGERLFASRDHGASWDAISDDLSHNDHDKLVASGGPITKDTSGAEIYCTIHAFAESPHDAGELWAGTDDGRVHVTTDGGGIWSEVTPPDLPKWATVASLDASPHEPGTVYLAAHNYRFQDHQPYVWVTSDRGQSWTSLAGGLPHGDHLRVVRSDPTVAGLLFAGSETGLFVSLDDGGTWQRFTGDFPVVPVYDLKVKDASLVVASHGRSFWVLDDLTPLRDVAHSGAVTTLTLFAPPTVYRRAPGDLLAHLLAGVELRPGKSYLELAGGPTILNVRTGETTRTIALDGGTNPPVGATLWYHLPAKIDPRKVTLAFLDSQGEPLASFWPKPADPTDDGEDHDREDDDGDGRATTEPHGAVLERGTHQHLPTQPGLNRFTWNLTTDGVRALPDAEGKVRTLPGPQVPPGTYRARLTVGDESCEADLEVRADPRLAATDEDLVTQYEMLIEARGLIQQVVDAIGRLKHTRNQARAWVARGDIDEDLRTAAKTLVSDLDEVERQLTNPEIEHPTHRLQKRAGLDAKLQQIPVVLASADAAPTRQAREAYTELSERARAALDTLDGLLDTTVPELNHAIRAADVPVIDTSLPPVHDPTDPS